MPCTYDLYLVRSPLQYLAAASAKTLSKSKSFLVVEFEQSEESTESKQIAALIDSSDWDKIVRIESSSRWRRIRTTWGMYRLASTCFFKRIYIGEYRDINFQLISSRFPVKARYLLDDGASTIFVQLRYLAVNRAFPEFTHLRVKQVIYYWFLHRCFPWGWRFRLRYHLVTEFTLSKTRRRGQAIVASPVLKHSEVDSLHEVWLFGSKYSDSGLMSLEGEIEYLTESIRILSEYGLPVVYIPHRGEQQKKLEKVEELGIPVKHLGLPVEKYIEKEKVRPKVVAAAWSTVLTTLPNRYDFSAVVCFSIPLSMFSEGVCERASTIYNYFRSVTGITVVDLEIGCYSRKIQNDSKK